MKKAIAIIALLSLFNGAYSQNAKRDAAGNYHALNYPVDSLETGKTFTNAKGESFAVFTTKKGRLFYGRISPKTGKYYRSFLRVEGEMKD